MAARRRYLERIRTLFIYYFGMVKIIFIIQHFVVIYSVKLIKPHLN